MTTLRPHRWLIFAPLVAMALTGTPALAQDTPGLPLGALSQALGDLVFEGYPAAFILCGLWIGLGHAGDRRRIVTRGLLGLTAGAALGLVIGLPPWLGTVVLAAALLAAALLIFPRRVPAAIASLPLPAIAALGGIRLGGLMRIPDITAGYLAVYVAAFASVALSLLCVGAIVALPLYRRGGTRILRGVSAWMAILGAIGAVAWPLSLQARPGISVAATQRDLAETEIPGVVKSLLEGVYTAFSQNGESETYDRLSAVLEGPVLEQLYLQRQSALPPDSADAPDSEVVRVDLETTDARKAATGTGYAVHAAWRVWGFVGHWGHEHERLNRYEADLTIAPSGGSWKISQFDLRDVVQDAAVQP
ncbi:MAG TPA: hypothetical protein PK286_04025 [Devosia sp.]|nr:hypothetical protein [Devosia sp.]